MNNAIFINNIQVCSNNILVSNTFYAYYTRHKIQKSTHNFLFRPLRPFIYGFANMLNWLVKRTSS